MFKKYFIIVFVSLLNGCSTTGLSGKTPYEMDITLNVRPNKSNYLEESAPTRNHNFCVEVTMLKHQMEEDWYPIARVSFYDFDYGNAVSLAYAANGRNNDFHTLFADYFKDGEPIDRITLVPNLKLLTPTQLGVNFTEKGTLNLNVNNKTYSIPITFSPQHIRYMASSTISRFRSKWNPC